LVFADWLDENGEANHARFIRGQIAEEVSTSEKDWRAHRELNDRSLADSLPYWLPFDVAGASQYVFRRGFVDKLWMVPTDFERYGIEILRRLPTVRWLVITADPKDSKNRALPLQSTRVEEFLQTIDKYNAPEVLGLDLTALSRSAARGNREILLALGEPGRVWKHLRRLRLDAGHLDAPSYNRFLANAEFPVLEKLELLSRWDGPPNNLSDANVARLASQAPTRFPRLRALAIQGPQTRMIAPLSEKSLEALAQASWKLESLQLKNMVWSSADLCVLARAPWAGNLKFLSVIREYDSNYIRNEELQAWIENETVQRPFFLEFGPGWSGVESETRNLVSPQVAREYLDRFGPHPVLSALAAPNGLN
jgi:hypothetical protein